MPLLLLLVVVAVLVGLLVGRHAARMRDVRYRPVPPPLQPGADPFATVVQRPEWRRY